MDSLITAAPINSLRIPSSPFHSTLNPKTLRFPSPLTSNSRVSVSSRISASSSSTPNPILGHIRFSAAGAVILTAALLAGRFPPPPSKADPLPSSTTEEVEEGETLTETEIQAESKADPLSLLLDSNSDAVANLLYSKLDEGDDAEALSILRRLIAAHPSETQWKFLAARLLNEMGDIVESRQLFEEILAVDPLSFEALFENAVLMDRSGEGESVIRRLERALDLARSEGQENSARDVRLIIAQIQFLQKNVDEALASYDELANEDPKDFRTYFCQGVIYSLLGRNKEAREKFAKYRELSPNKEFEVNGYLQTPLSRVKLFRTGDSES